MTSPRPRRQTIIVVVLLGFAGALAAWFIASRLLPHIAADRGAPAEAVEGLAGQLLVATPRMTDPRFAGSVIYMVADDEGGAMGLVVNRLFGHGPLSTLLDGFGISDRDASGTVALYYGGPVMPRQGFILHSGEYTGPQSRAIAPGVALATGPGVLRAMAAGDGPRQSRVMLGYAGWAPGQLEGEIARGDWLTASAGPAVVFDEDVDTLWTRIYPRAGKSL